MKLTARLLYALVSPAAFFLLFFLDPLICAAVWVIRGRGLDKFALRYWTDLAEHLS